MVDKTKILIVDDHPLFSMATEGIIKEIPGIVSVGIARNAQQGMTMLKKFKPDLIILDYLLPDQHGSEVAKIIKAEFPEIKIIILTGFDMFELYNTFVTIGVEGILSKEASSTTLKNTISMVLDNHTAIPTSLFKRTQTVQDKTMELGRLTKDEINIMNMLVDGATHEKIADAIFMSKRTVDNYLRKIYEKLGVTSRAHALEKFISIYQTGHQR